MVPLVSWSGRKWSRLACTVNEADEVERYCTRLTDDERDYIAARFRRYGKLGPSPRNVLALLGEWESYGKGFAWPSMRRIEETTGLARSTVQLAIDDLEHRGLIFVYRPPDGQRRANGRMIGNKYRLAVPETLRVADLSWLPNAANGQDWHFLDELERIPGWLEWENRWADVC